jgi:glycosyltransferase involved in cell wall biosynthesis
LSLTAIILAHNEARHISRAIASVAGVAQRIVVVDSGSTDATCAIATGLGAEVLHNGWINYATQFNWALDHAQISTDWILRLDADEVVLPTLASALKSLSSQTATGLTVNRQIHFLGRFIRWGGIYPVRALRVWRNGHGRCEDRWMDEHILVDGPVAHLDADIADINLNSVTWWTAKHNGYATREAIDELLRQTQADSAAHGAIGGQAKVKRWVKRHIYAHLPLGGRAVVYFLYRYIIRLGVLDGWQGLAFHGLQGGWYRFLVDVKIAEMRATMLANDWTLDQLIQSETGAKQ